MGGSTYSSNSSSFWYIKCCSTFSLANNLGYSVRTDLCKINAIQQVGVGPTLSYEKQSNATENKKGGCNSERYEYWCMVPFRCLQERQLFGNGRVDTHQLPQVVERHAQPDPKPEPLHHLCTLIGLLY